MKRRSPVKIILLALFFGVLLLAAVVLIRTLTYPFHKNSNDRTTGVVDTDVSPLSIERFSGGIRIPTIGRENYEDVDFTEFDRFKQYLTEVYPEIYKVMDTMTVNKYGMLLRWKGTDSSSEPILFLSHYDVVPVDNYEQAETGDVVSRPGDADKGPMTGFADSWDYPPFSGAVADGRIYGRGTLDMKCVLFSVMEAADALIKEGFQPKQDIWFAFGQDEENGGMQGAMEIVKYFKSQNITFDAVYDEGGLVSAPGLGGINAPIAVVGVAEKGFSTIKIKVRGIGGHSSMPPAKGSLVQAAEIIGKLNNEQMPLMLIPPISSFLDNVGAYMPFMSRMAIANKWLLKDVLLKQMAKTAQTNALVRTTTAVTMAKGSEAPNVMSALAEVTVNYRILPGNSTEEVLEHVRKVCEGYDVELDTDHPREASNISPNDSKGFRMIEDVVEKIYPDAVTASYITIAGTDAYKYEAVSRNVYRFMPVLLNEYEQRTIHNENEHISITNYGRMIAFYKEIMRTYEDME